MMGENGERETKKRVFVVDPQPIVRKGLINLINSQPDLQVCQAVEKARAAYSGIRAMNPDILLADILLDGPDGLELLKQIRKSYPTLHVLMFSMSDESIYAERALRSGARGYLMKNAPCKKILTAIRQVLRDRIYVSERIARRILRKMTHGDLSDSESSVDLLSDRELEVFRLIGEGCTTRQISQRLSISVKTVETYQANIKRKLELRSGHELTYYAIASQK